MTPMTLTRKMKEWCVSGPGNCFAESVCRDENSITAVKIQRVELDFTRKNVCSLRLGLIESLTEFCL